MFGTLLTHMIAREVRKPPLFFQRWTFQRMLERGNTHYCCQCGGQVGFKPGPAGEPTQHVEDSGYNPMDQHNESHVPAVIANADKYDNPWDWLEGEINPDFPFVIHIPSL